MNPSSAAELPANPTAFKTAMNRLVAGVSIITTSARGTRFGMVVTNLASVGVKSPALLICVNGQASMHGPLVASGHFCVNFLRQSQAVLATVFASKPSGEARFAHGNWSGDASGVPTLNDGLASMSCRVESSFPFDSQTIFIGRVTEIHIYGPLDPLVYVEGAFSGLDRTDGAAAIAAR